MKAFVEGMGAPSSVEASAPWSWATNQPNFARRIMKVMTDMGVRQDLSAMAVADTNELAVCDKAWLRLRSALPGSAGRQ